LTEYVLSLSYGKDSLACLGAIEKLGLPLDRIIHAEVWATDTIPAACRQWSSSRLRPTRLLKSGGVLRSNIFALLAMVRS